MAEDSWCATEQVDFASTKMYLFISRLTDIHVAKATFHMGKIDQSPDSLRAADKATFVSTEVATMIQCQSNLYSN